MKTNYIFGIVCGLLLLAGIGILFSLARHSVSTPLPSPDATSTATNTPAVSTSTTAVPSSAQRGMLTGVLSVGPLCPVERSETPCAPTPETYAARPVSVYNSARTKLIVTLIPDKDGAFSASLPAGSYIVDVEHQSVGSVEGAPAIVVVTPGNVVRLSIRIDTGIR